MRHPTTAEWEQMFHQFSDKAESEKLNRRAWELVKTARESKAFLDVAEGMMRATLSGISLAGINAGAAAMTLALGFYLGSTFTESAQVSPVEDQEVIDDYLKKLEQQANSLEPPKDADHI